MLYERTSLIKLIIWADEREKNEIPIFQYMYYYNLEIYQVANIVVENCVSFPLRIRRLLFCSGNQEANHRLVAKVNFKPLMVSS